MTPLWTDLSLPLLAPGLFVRLDNQPADMPAFVLDYCKGDRCWIRQQSWGPSIHWGVPRSRLQPAN
jgi:hypothetical protein